MMLAGMGAVASQGELIVPLYTEGVQNVPWRFSTGQAYPTGFKSDSIYIGRYENVLTTNLLDVTPYKFAEIEMSGSNGVPMWLSFSGDTTPVSKLVNMTSVRTSYIVDISTVTIPVRLNIYNNSGAQGQYTKVYSVKLIA